MTTLSIAPGAMTLAQLRTIYETPVNIDLPATADADIAAGKDCVDRILAEDRTAYGINTGFGLLAQTRIASDQLEELQHTLIMSHSTGVGETNETDLVRLEQL